MEEKIYIIKKMKAAGGVKEVHDEEKKVRRIRKCSKISVRRIIKSSSGI